MAAFCLEILSGAHFCFATQTGQPTLKLQSLTFLQSRLLSTLDFECPPLKISSLGLHLVHLILHWWSQFSIEWTYFILMTFRATFYSAIWKSSGNPVFQPCERKIYLIDGVSLLNYSVWHTQCPQTWSSCSYYTTLHANLKFIHWIATHQGLILQLKFHLPLFHLTFHL